MDLGEKGKEKRSDRKRKEKKKTREEGRAEQSRKEKGSSWQYKNHLRLSPGGRYGVGTAQVTDGARGITEGGGSAHILKQFLAYLLTNVLTCLLTHFFTYSLLNLSTC